MISKGEINYMFTGIPNGQYRLRMGAAEDKWQEGPKNINVIFGLSTVLGAYTFVGPRVFGVHSARVCRRC